jgi:hypothetical protein
MFGVIPVNHAIAVAGGGPAHTSVQAGWDNAVNPVAIVAGTGITLSQQRRFENIFRIIAANRIGRLLLYRILIEIRRHNADNGICEHGITCIPNRNFNRSVNINWDNSLSFSPGGTAVIATIRFNDKIIPTNAVFTRWTGLNYHKIDRCSRPPEVGLFHEMVHWFHMLRAPVRMARECKAYMLGVAMAPVNLLGSGREETIGSYFWGNLKNNNANNRKISAVPWTEDKEINGVSRERAQVINFEDVRTILGSPSLVEFRTVVPLANQFQYFEGDDLSENSFRVSLGMPIRLGHTSMDFYEDY